MNKDLKNKSVNGIFWSFVENFSLKIMQFLIGIVMARFLIPSDYGLIAMLAIFLSIFRNLY